MSSDLISEREASSWGGVALSTLRRFADAGYLKVEENADGRFFCAAELAKLFGLDYSTKPLRQAEKQPPAPPSACTAKPSPAPAAMRKESASLEPSQDESSPQAFEHSAQVAKMLSELNKTKTILELQDKLLDAREHEIADLKRERDWLRSRIEKLEQKSERDQLLLLAETQTIRKLVQYREQRSPVVAALEWLGLKEPPALESSRPIEVNAQP